MSRALVGVVVALLAAGLPLGAAFADDIPQTDWPPTTRHSLYRSLPPRTYAPRILYAPARAVYKLPKGLDGLAAYDKTLTQACMAGTFQQMSDGYYWAVTPGRRYGVAFSGGANLEDPQNKRQPGKVYFFLDQDARCSVYVGDQAKLMPNYIPPV
ncbi:hypothetical protein D3877_26490 [Azospirillum cavernae]|uniref:Secreted protein n=1 Tax=Azospirillum cavernae TaxID=2320860 RepID=A0A418VMK1_9PROT|nr:hypothetical protein D3877_26490 [Azospirillum cavernae]